jgi:hypothetical protein
MEKIHEIDLKTMIPPTNKKSASFTNGELIIHSSSVQTPESYMFPLSIDVTVKTDSTNIRLYYKDARVILNWEVRKDELRIHDMLTGKGYGYWDRGRVPENEYVDVTWILDRTEMLVLVNDELRHVDDDYPYMAARAVTQNQKICEPFKISGAFGSIVAVKSLKITEL